MTLSALKVQGPFRGDSGHDHHVREFVRALHSLGVEIELVDHPGWGSTRLPPDKSDPFFGSLDRPVDASVFLRFAMPHQVLVEPGMVNVNYTMFEATRIHSSWVDQAYAYDLVVVPNETCRETWIACGAPAQRVRVCPLGVDGELFGRPAPPLLEEPHGVRFLNVSALNERKNLRALPRVWMQATTAADDAVLIMKLGADAAGLARFRAEIDETARELGKTTADAAPIRLVGDRFADREMPRLYASATHYVSVSFGEAWDLPMMEAAASGLELIAPWHSAYKVYLDSETAHLIPCSEVPCGLEPHQQNYVLFRDASWWEPDERQAVDTIRSIVSGAALVKPPPRERVLREFTWEAAARRLLDLLTEVEQREARPLSRLRRRYGSATRARGRPRSGGAREQGRP